MSGKKNQSLAVSNHVNSEASDNELIALVLKDNQEAFAVLYSRYRETVRIACHTVLYNQSDIEDMVQEVFLVLFKRLLRKYDSSRSTFRSWLIGVAKREAHNYNRVARSRNIIKLDPLAPKGAISDSLRSSIDTFDDKAEGIIARMQKYHWVPVTLWALEGWSKRKVNEFMGWKRSASVHFVALEEDLAEALKMVPLPEHSPCLTQYRELKQDLPNIKQLPPAKRVPYLMFIGGASNREISTYFKRTSLKYASTQLYKARRRLKLIRQQAAEPLPASYREVEYWVRAQKKRRKAGSKSLSLLKFIDKLDPDYRHLLMQRLILKAPVAGALLNKYLSYKPGRRPSYPEFERRTRKKYVTRALSYGMEWIIRQTIVHYLSGKTVPGFTRRVFEDLVSRLNSELSICNPPKGKRSKQPQAKTVYRED